MSPFAELRVGHVTHPEAQTGCTVVLFPEGTVASGEVRGGAPGTREFALLAPERMVRRLDAVVLAGGSAFGLAAADGVMRWCAERERGFDTAGGRVPIVVGMVLYDLAVGNGSRRPGADDGYRACEAAGPWPDQPLGRVGAAAGATTAKWRGKDHARPGGLGVAVAAAGRVQVGAVVAVNAWGEVIPAGGVPPVADVAADYGGEGFNTTIGVMVTNAALDKTGCYLLAQSGHDGLAMALWPVHTTADGDALVAASLPAAGEAAPVEAPLELVRMLGVAAVAEAIRSAVPVNGTATAAPPRHGAGATTTPG